MKKLISFIVMILSVNCFAESSGSYECKIVSSVSTKAYEAGRVFQVLVSGMDITISNEKIIGSCTTKAKKTKSDYIKVVNAMNDCGFDGVDMLLPIEMQDQAEKSTVVVSSNGSFDIYSCTLNAMIEF